MKLKRFNFQTKQIKKLEREKYCMLFKILFILSYKFLRNFFHVIAKHLFDLSPPNPPKIVIIDCFFFDIFIISSFLFLRLKCCIIFHKTSTHCAYYTIEVSISKFMRSSSMFRSNINREAIKTIAKQKFSHIFCCCCLFLLINRNF